MKQKATKAHVAGLITGAGTLLAAYVNGTLDQAMIESFLTAIALAGAAWISAYLPANKPKA